MKLLDRLAPVASAGISSWYGFRIEQARIVNRTIQRVWSSPNAKQVAKNLLPHIPGKNNSAVGGPWPMISGQNFEVLTQKFYNLANTSRNKTMKLFEGATIPTFDGLFVYDGRFAGMFQIKLSNNAISDAIKKMNANGKNAKKATLIVPKNNYEQAISLAKDKTRVKASALTSKQSHFLTRTGIKTLSKSNYTIVIIPEWLFNLMSISTTAFLSVGVGALIDEIKILFGRTTRSGYVTRRANDIVDGLISWLTTYSIYNLASFSLRYPMLHGPGTLVVVNPYVAILGSSILNIAITQTRNEILNG